MIGSLLLFLGSAGYLAGRAACSNIAKSQINSHTNNMGTNVQRQMELERMAVGASPYDRTRFVSLLENADLSKASMQTTHEAKRKELLEKYGKFESYSRAYNKIHCFSDMITINDSDYAVWIIAQSEGWTYEKKIINTLPSYCYGYAMHNDSYVKNRAKWI